MPRARTGWKLQAMGLAFLMALSLLLLPNVAKATEAASGQRVDTSYAGEIVLKACPVDGQTFTVYRVATMGTDGSITAVDALRPAVEATGMDSATLTSGDVSADMMQQMAESWKGYVLSDASSFWNASKTAKGGTATFSGLVPGCYLIVADTYTSGNMTWLGSSWLVTIPSVNADGTYIYSQDVEATKLVSVETQEFENVVQKLWKDAGNHPSSVEVEIYNGSELYKQVTLDASNDWTFAWEGEGSWSVKEAEDSTSGYKASISSSVKTEGTTTTSVWQITNTGTTTTKTTTEKLKDMGDTNGQNLMLALMGAGAALLVLGIVLSRRRRDA